MEQRILGYLARLGYPGIFASMMLGLIGLPIPDEVLMAFTGYLVYRGDLVYLPALLSASAGAISGVSFSYWIGRRFGTPLLEKYGARIGLTEEKLRRTEKWFTRFGRYAVTLSYFIPGVRHLSAYSAGISGWPYRTFFAYAAPGGLVWAFVFVTLGRMAGRSWLTFSHTMHHYLLYIGYGAAAAALVGWRLYKRRREEA